MAESAFIVRIPQAQERFGALRARLDPSAPQGLPAHVTLLVPFMAPEWIGPQVLATAERAIGGVPAFDVEFAQVCRWPTTAWLAPRPAAPFIALTRALATSFPAFPPYGGRHAEVIPHLTLADGSQEGAAIAQARAEALLRSSGPVRAHCREVELIENSSGIWRTMHVVALGEPRPPLPGSA